MIAQRKERGATKDKRKEAGEGRTNLGRVRRKVKAHKSKPREGSIRDCGKQGVMRVGRKSISGKRIKNTKPNGKNNYRRGAQKSWESGARKKKKRSVGFCKTRRSRTPLKKNRQGMHRRYAPLNGLRTGDRGKTKRGGEERKHTKTKGGT